MGYSVDIDTGGTFTDCYVSGGGTSIVAEADTTPHDLTVGLSNAIKEAAEKLSYHKVGDFLKQVDRVRISTTQGLNTLIQGTGPRLGLIVTKGFEEAAYGDSDNPALDYLVPRDMVLGISGEVDAAGRVVAAVDETEVLGVIRELLTRGARKVVASLRNAALNPQLEKELRAAVERRYPPHYLGSIPLVLSTEISRCADDALRTNAALLNAYVHDPMVRLLYKGESDIQEDGYHKPVFVVHIGGGTARVARTKALMTCGSGPAAGLFGVQFLSRLYRIPNMVGFDVGGTSTDIGLVAGGRCNVTYESELAGIPLRQHLVDVHSIGAGGGSIARVAGRELRVGPESAGAIPGPACYDLGGTAPTLTDAFVVLGLLDPENFLGGKKKLNVAKAHKAIEQQIAVPLGLKVEEAAQKIREQIAASCVQALTEVLARRGLAPKECALVSYGGAGGFFASDLARGAGIPKVLVPPGAAAFSAFGSSTMGITHEYETFVGLPLRLANCEFPSDFTAINQAIEQLKAKAVHDLAFEKIAQGAPSFELLLELRSAMPYFSRGVFFPKLRFEAAGDAAAACAELSYLASAQPEGEVLLERAVIRASVPLAPVSLKTYPHAGRDPRAALKGQRRVYWDGRFQELPIYDQEKLRSGNLVAGPAILEAEDTTITLHAGQRYTVDQYLTGIIEEG